MPNQYFKFKEFSIKQDKCAMKVGTDGVLLGAWCDCANAAKVLDIGTGTGLIALMIAQRCSASVAAVELDNEASEQAKDNVLQSSWSDRINVVHNSIQDYVGEKNERFDLIVCNPPYFNASLKSEDESRSLARHSDTLPTTDLLNVLAALLSPKGKFCVVMPYVEGSVFIAEAVAFGLYCSKKLNIQPTPSKDVKRLLLEFTFLQQPCEEESMIIEDKGRHKYSKEYFNLTKDFYLHL